jgi:hypothetical protein
MHRLCLILIVLVAELSITKQLSAALPPTTKAALSWENSLAPKWADVPPQSDGYYYMAATGQIVLEQ